MIQSRSLFWVLLSFPNTKLYTLPPIFLMIDYWVLVKLRILNNLLINFLDNKFCDKSALFPDRHTNMFRRWGFPAHHRNQLVSSYFILGIKEYLKCFENFSWQLTNNIFMCLIWIKDLTHTVFRVIEKNKFNLKSHRFQFCGSNI